jgi:hypothetical protein
LFFDTAVGGDRWATHFANAQQAEFQYGLAEIAAKHGLNQVWFEAKKNVLADGGLGGANPDAPYVSPASPNRLPLLPSRC